MFSIKESKKRISRTKDPLNVISRKASGLTIDSHAWGKCLGAAFPVKSIAPVCISPSLNLRYQCSLCKSFADLQEARRGKPGQVLLTDIQQQQVGRGS